MSMSALNTICWGVIGLGALFLVLKYVVQPLISNRHEAFMKDKVFDQEKYWHFQSALKIDFKKQLEEKQKEIEKERGNLKAEKADRESKLKQERLQAEYEFYKKIVETFFPKEETQIEK